MGLGNFLSKLRGDQRAMPDPGSAEFQQAVEGSALPGSAQMNQDGWVSAAEAATGGIAGGLTSTSVEVEGHGTVEVAGAVTAESLIAAGVPVENAQQTAAALAQIQQAFGGGAIPGGGTGAENVSISQGVPQALDLRAMQGLRDQMMVTLREHGVDPDSGQTLDASEVPGLQEAVLKVLADNGVDVSQMGGPGGTTGQAGPPG